MHVNPYVTYYLGNNPSLETGQQSFFSPLNTKEEVRAPR